MKEGLAGAAEKTKETAEAAKEKTKETTSSTTQVREVVLSWHCHLLDIQEIKCMHSPYHICDSLPWHVTVHASAVEACCSTDASDIMTIMRSRRTCPVHM